MSDCVVHSLAIMIAPLSYMQEDEDIPVKEEDPVIDLMGVEQAFVDQAVAESLNMTQTPTKPPTFVCFICNRMCV